jgi:hypothetical protein
MTRVKATMNPSKTLTVVLAAVALAVGCGGSGGGGPAAPAPSGKADSMDQNTTDPGTAQMTPDDLGDTSVGPDHPVMDYPGGGECQDQMTQAVVQFTMRREENENGVTIRNVTDLASLGVTTTTTKVYVYDISEEAGTSLYVGVIGRENCQVLGIVEVAQDSEGFAETDTNKCKDNAVTAVQNYAMRDGMNENGITIGNVRDTSSVSSSLAFNQTKAFLVDTSEEAGASTYLVLLDRDSCVARTPIEISQD